MTPRPTWPETWLEISEIIGKRSRCDLAQVGAVVVDKDQRIAATGYNGPAANFDISLGPTCTSWCDRAAGKSERDGFYDACPSIHAEANALLYVDRSRVEGGSIYVNRACCIQCAKLISNSGLASVHMKITDADAHRAPERVAEYMRSCGVVVLTYDERTAA